MIDPPAIDELVQLAKDARASVPGSEDRFHCGAGLRQRTRHGYPYKEFGRIPRLHCPGPDTGQVTEIRTCSASAGSGPTVVTSDSVVSLPGGKQCMGVSFGSMESFTFKYRSTKFDGPTELLIPFGQEFFLVGLRTSKVERRQALTGDLVATFKLPEKLEDAQDAGDRLVGVVGKNLVAYDLLEESGNELWRVELDLHPYQWRATPSRVFARSQDGEIVAWSVEDGAEEWRIKSPAAFLPEADAKGVLLLQGGHTLSERDAKTGKERWTYAEPDQKVIGVALGTDVALVRRLVSVTTPSEDPFEFPTVTEQHQLVGIQRETGEVLFNKTIGQPKDQLVVTDSRVCLFRTDQGQFQAELLEVLTGEASQTIQAALPEPDPMWWHVSLAPGANGPRIHGVDLRAGPLSADQVDPRMCLATLT